jgi:adenosylcobinamide kinase/adenosylcobinamide-phosphate guanylyltransferase
MQSRPQAQRIVLVTGGARSGKSTFAEECARQSEKRVVYVATAAVADAEMGRRIAEHRRRRPPAWETVEEPLNLDLALRQNDAPNRLFVVDCLTILLSNHLLARTGLEGERLASPEQRILNPDPRLTEDQVLDEILEYVQRVASIIPKLRADLILVTNEVGLGLVPDNPLGRLFRDLAGKANQVFAALAGEVYFVVSGIPLRVK